jgi:HD-GYP domain-containing protein (c-di-GMP phosphodiesterase class II)
MSLNSKDRLHKLLHLLSTAAANAALYNLQHLQVLRLNKQAMEQVQALFATAGEISLKIIDNLLVYNNHPVPETPPIRRFIDALKRHSINFLRITPGIYNEELLELINILSKGSDRPAAVSSSEHLHFGQLEVRRRSPSHDWGLEKIAAREADHLLEIYDAVRAGESLDLTTMHHIVDGFIASFHQQKNAFMALAPLRAMDEYTYTHSTNICILNIAQAQSLGIEGKMLTDIGLAAMLHDVGKMFIPHDILAKAGQLSEDEWDIMQQHPVLGADYLLKTPGIPHLAVVIAYEHHMRYDGNGYPRCHQPWTLHLGSHMTAISDTYDAMRTHRTYDAPMDLEQITDIMLNLAGTKLHPQLTRNFIDILHRLELSGLHSNPDA